MNMGIKIWCFVVVVCSWNIACARAENPGGCILKLEDGNPIDVLDWDFSHFLNTPMNDNAAPGTVIYTFSVENVISVTPRETLQPSHVDYVTYVLRGDKLMVEVTNNILTYEANEVDTVTINTVVDFMCGGGASDMAFNVPVIFANNHDPVFAADTADVIDLPMPYPNGLLVRTITVTDIDMGTKVVELTLDATGQDLFTVVRSTEVGCGGSEEKVFKFDLKAKKLLQLEGPTEVVATVTTTQFGVSLSAEATLSFHVNESISTPPTPRFTQAVYTGAIDVDTAAGTVIALDHSVGFEIGYNDDVTVEILSGINVDKALFEVSIVNEEVQLKLKTALPSDTEETHMILTLEATRPSAAATGLTVIVLSLPPKDCGTTPAPQTTVECPEITCPDAPTTTECAVVTCEPCLTTVDPGTTTECPICPTTEEPTECPMCPTTEEPTVCPTTEEPTECPVCPTTEGPTECPTTGEPTVCPTTEEPTECPVCPTTEEPTVCPTTEEPTVCPTTCEPCLTTPTDCPQVTTECPTTCEPCPTTPGTGSTDAATCPTTTEPTECPTTCEPCATTPGTGSTDAITCPTTTDPTECPLTCPPTDAPTECPTTCEPCATTPGTGSTDVTNCPITTEPTECPLVCPSTDGPTECPTTCEPCPTPPGPGSGTIVFEPPSYSTTINAAYTGPVIQVNVVTDPAEPVTYKIDTDNPVVDADIRIDSDGVITSFNLVPGSYSFNVVATVVGTTLSAKASVIIRVRPMVSCGDAMLFTYALVVTSVAEGVEAVVTPGQDIGDPGCVYELLEGSKYFTIDAATGELSTILNALDREDPSFNGEENPTVKAVMRVTCPEALTNKDARAFGPQLDYLWSVEAINTDMTVIVVIGDVNDNTPVFDDVSPLVIGYPDSSLTSQLNPASLYTVKATDADIGRNAELDYTLFYADSNFYLHPQTGNLYIVNAAALNSDHNLTVVAVDEAGVGRISEPLIVKVKILSRSHVTEMVVADVLVEDVAAILEKLSTATNLTVRALDAAVLPRQATQTRRDGTLLRLVVYAVDNDEQVVPSETFIEQLLADPSLSINVQEMKELPDISIGQTTDTSGLLAAVITLGVLCGVLLVAGGVAFYFFYVRPRMLEKARLEELMSDSSYDSSSNVSGEEAKSEDGDTKVNVSSWMEQTGEENPAMDGDATDSFNMTKSPSTPDLEEVTVDRGVLTEFVMPDADASTTVAYENVDLPRTTGVDDVEEFDEDEERRKARLAERKRSAVTFNESVDCIEIESERG